VINLCPWQRMQLEEASKLLPIHRPPLTAAVEPFPQYPGRSVEEPPYMCQVEGHPVIADVPSEFGTERGPEGGEALLILPGACPLLDPLELGPESFPTGFHLGHRRPFARPPPVEEEAQKLEGALRLSSPGCLFGEGDQPRFLLMETQPIFGEPLSQRTENTLRIPRVLAPDHRSSSARESHPRALSDPDVNLAAHPAPIVQPQAVPPSANAQRGAAAVGQSARANAWLGVDGLSASCISAWPP
jgi:hypothetical protein